MLAEAKAARSPAIYTALVIALKTGMRDKEIRHLQWNRIDLERAAIMVGDSKTDAGTGRTIPMVPVLLNALKDRAGWFMDRFGAIESHWYVFPGRKGGKPKKGQKGQKRPLDPTIPATTFKTAWQNVRKSSGAQGRLHDTRHTVVTALLENPEATPEAVRSIVGHVSDDMLRRYAHLGWKAKQQAISVLDDSGPSDPAQATESAPEAAHAGSNSGTSATDSATSATIS